MVTLGLTLIEAVVAPVLQRNDVPPDAVSVAVSPLQIAGFEGVMLHIGAGLTVTVALHELEHPSESVTVTVYEVVAVGLTVIEAVVAPVLQRNDVPPDAVRVDEPPIQIEGLELVMLHTGSGVTITLNEWVAVFPQASVAIMNTVVVPTGNVSPEAGVLVTVTGPGQLSTAVIKKVTMLSHPPTTVSGGHTIPGGMVSVVQVKV